MSARMHMVRMWNTGRIQQGILLAPLFLGDDRVGLPGDKVDVLVLPCGLKPIHVHLRRKAAPPEH